MRNHQLNLDRSPTHPSAEVAQLKRAVQRHTRAHAQLRALAEIAVAEPDAGQLAKRLAERIGGMLQAQQTLVGITQGDRVLFNTVYEKGQHRPITLHYAMGQGLLGWMMATKKPYLCHDVAVDPLIALELAQTFGCRTLLAIPILDHQQHILGLIQCHDRRGGLPFGHAELELGQSIATLIAPAIERANLYGKMAEWANATANLLAFNASLNGQLEPHLLLQRLVEYASGFLGADGGMAGLVDADGVPSVAIIGVERYWQQGRWHQLHKQWARGDGLAGWVLINECTYLTNDYAADKLADHDLLTAFHVQSALCIPIMDAQQQVLGFLELHNKGSGNEPFTWSDAQYMESVAGATAVALRNVWLLRELQEQQQQLQELSARNISLLENERHRIARELHDEAGQALIGIKLGLQVLAKKVAATHPELRQEVDQLRQVVNESTIQIKGISQALRPPTLDELGLQAAIQNLASEFQDQITIHLHVSPAAQEMRLPHPIETACYRITQEALTNILRHAQAGNAWINLTFGAATSEVQLTIRDDGCGFDLETIQTSTFGLLGMRERATMLGGTLNIVTVVGHGTTIAVSIPIA